MASDPVITDVDREQIREYLGEILRAGDDFGRFVEEQFDTLETLAAKLQDRERELDTQRATVGSQLAGLTQARERLEAATLAAERWATQAQSRGSTASTEDAPDYSAQIATALAGLQSDHSAQITSALAGLQSNHVQLNNELAAAQARLKEELAAAQVQAQLHFKSLAESVAAELAEARAQLTAAREELAQERERISGAAEPLLSAAAAAVSAVTAAPRVVETVPPASVPIAAAPIESTPSTTPTAEPSFEPRRTTDAPAPAAAKTDAPTPAEDETAGWWGELQQLRRGLSKAVQPQGDAPPRRTKTPTPS